MPRQPVGITLVVGLLIAGANGILRASETNDANTREGIEFFEKKIRPVLVERCYECHSAKAKKPKGGLRLDSRQGILRGGDSGRVIVSGDPERSLLIRAIRYSDSE